MQLVDREIRESIESGLIRITPFNKSYVNPNSYDIRLSENFVYYKPYDGSKEDDYVGHIIDPYDKDSIEREVVRYTGETFVIHPQQFVLASTIEHIEIGPYICAQLAGKSSIARLGIQVHQTAGFIDAGFKGTLTFELFNANCRPVKLYAGMRIGQLIFTGTTGSCKPYDARSHSKYMDQHWPELSRYYMNEKPYMRLNHV